DGDADFCDQYVVAGFHQDVPVLLRDAADLGRVEPIVHGVIVGGPGGGGVGTLLIDGQEPGCLLRIRHPVPEVLVMCVLGSAALEQGAPLLPPCLLRWRSADDGGAVWQGAEDQP